MKNLFTIKFLWCLFCVALMSVQSHAQIAAWNTFDQTAYGTQGLAPSTKDANVTVIGLTRGSGVTTTSTAAGKVWGGNGWSDVSASDAITSSKFITFSITPNAFFRMSLSSINPFIIRVSTTGPINFLVQYQIGSGSFTDISSQSITRPSSSTTNFTLSPIDLSTTPALQNISPNTTITFRIVPYSSTAAGGVLYIGNQLSTNSLAINGTVTSTVSSNAGLSNLVISTGTLSPAFSSSTTSYTSSVANATSSMTVTPTASDAGATIKVNGTAVTSGSASGSISLNVGSNTITTVVTAQDGTTTKTYTLVVTRAASGTPTLVATSALADFGNVCVNTVAGPNSFTIDGSNLDGSNGSNISIAALPGFTYAESATGSYTSTLSFSYTAPGFTGKTIYVKFSPTAVQSYNGNIVLSGGGVASYSVAATGSGVNTANTVTTGPTSSVTATTATVTGTVGTNGCEAVTAYGFYYSLNTGFPDGTGTIISSSNISAGNFSATITNLTPNQRYYYKAFATTAGGTSYGSELSFTNMPLPVPMASQPGLSFTENFADIANWSNFFITGIGANHFDGLSATGTGGIPNGTTLTAATNSFQGVAFGSSGGVQKGTNQTTSTQSIVLLSTGSPDDNTSSAAIDFYMDFTGVNAGTVSFDWASVNNSTGNRNGSLRIYTSIDGTNFTELTFASVLNFTNNAPTNGTKNNIALPASFNNNPNAILRFYYYNGSGGTTGSRPKISIDNLTVTAVATTPCTRPTAPATSFVFGTVTDVSIQGSFTASNPTANSYVVVMSTNQNLVSGPVDGQLYAIGDDIGDGTVVSNTGATSFTATGLTAQTRYYFFVFPVNNVCTGGPLYYTTNVLTASVATVAGLPNCAAPSSQPTSLIFGATTSNSIQASFTATTADEYLVVRSTFSSLNTNPVNGQVYNAQDVLGNGVVVSRNATTSFTSTGLTPNTQYYYFVFSLNSQNCVNGPVYNVTSPLSGAQTTAQLPACTTPATQPTNLNLTATNTSVSGTFTGVVDADNYLIIRSTDASLSAMPADNTNYATGDNLGGGVVVANRSNTSFLSTGLATNTTYNYFVFASNNNCSGGTKYATAAALTGSVTTTNALANNYYFGTLHSHSDYSDGNKDHPGYTPTQDYDFAKTALCMDYLGISEHNHFSSTDNPGNHVSTYHTGITEANNFTTANSGFLALYGMEWGVISGGGHVVVYGAGMDDLWGWESGSGPWGTTSNYDVYVAKNDYTGVNGLFSRVNINAATNTFASLAHPNTGDYNNLANVPYDEAADFAISATAVESGPAFSTNVTYTEPASPMSYLSYYKILLSKGYHVGPSIDHDNHYTTFGKTTYSRTAVVSPGLSKTEIISAMKNMSFYATHDCDSKVDFSINTKTMGSLMVDRFAPNISVTLTDGTTSTNAAVIRVMFGLPGSGITPVKIDSVIGNKLNFSDFNLADGATGYYYIDISNGSARIITSPIWYNRVDNAALPITLVSFDVQKIDKSAKLIWSTVQEFNSSHFVIERSSNGTTWNSIATVNAAGNSYLRINYNFFDNAPMQGLNFYRLKMVDKDGSYEYSDIRKALFNSNYTAEVAPNPAKDVINLYITKAGNQQANIELLNMEGKVMYRTTSSQSHVPIKTQGMAKGLYFVKIIESNKVTTIRVMLQ